MKKKVFNGILLGTAAMLCAGGFAACEATDGKNEASPLMKSGWNRATRAAKKISSTG